MPRWLRIACWFAVLGAAANVGLAMVASAWDEQKLADPLLIAKLRRAAWAEHERQGSTDERWIQIAYSDWCGDIVLDSGSIQADVAGEPPLNYERVSHRAGWPFRVLRGEQTTSVIDGKPLTKRTEYRSALKLARPVAVGHANPALNAGPAAILVSTCPRLLPYKPMWAGLAANSAAYGVSLWLLLALPRLVRWQARRMRGRCGGCGYPRGASNVCTECGKPVRAVVAKLTA